MNIETKREKQRRQTYSKLIRIAYNQFAQKGLMATTTADIARKARVSHGTVFAHFPTREDLVVTVIEDFGEQIIRRINELAEKGIGLRELLGAHLQVIEEHEDFYARLVMEAPVLPAEARVILTAIQSAISFHLYYVAKVELQAGTIRPVPMHLLFNTWIGLIHYYLTNKKLFAPGQSVIKRRGRELLEHYMGLLSFAEGGKT